MHVRECVFLSECVCVYVYVSECVCVFVYVSVCVYVSEFLYDGEPYW